jgi:hypothetical protein
MSVATYVTPERFFNSFLDVVGQHEFEVNQCWSSKPEKTGLVFDKILPRLAAALHLNCEREYFRLLDAVLYDSHDFANFGNWKIRAEYISVAVEHENDAGTRAISPPPGNSWSLSVSLARNGRRTHIERGNSNLWVANKPRRFEYKVPLFVSRRIGQCRPGLALIDGPALITPPLRRLRPPPFRDGLDEVG